MEHYGMKTPTRLEVARLMEEFQHRYTPKRGILEEFKNRIEGTPKSRTLKFFLSTFSTPSYVSRILRGLVPLRHECSLCSGYMVNTDRYCSNECFNRHLRDSVERTNWKVLDLLKNSSGRTLKVKVKCPHCDRVWCPSASRMLTGCDCKCQRVVKLTKTHVIQARESFWKTLKERNLPIKVYGKYKNSHEYMKCECLDCGTTHYSLPQSILKARCSVCSQGKREKTMGEKYGFPHSFQVPELMAKMRKTMIERYGYPHALQNPECFNKMQVASADLRPIEWAGKTALVQGYEPQALRWIKKNSSLKESQVICGLRSNRPRIKFIHENGSNGIYTPDFWIPHLNMLIEVKSKRTLEKDLAKNILKFEACKRAGFRFVLMVMTPDGKRIYAKIDKRKNGDLQSSKIHYSDRKLAGVRS